MKPYVAVTDSPAGADISIERSVLAEARVEKVSWTDIQSLTAALADADAIMCMHAPIRQPVIACLRRCKVIARFGTGLDNIDREAAATAGIPVVGVQDYCTQEVANHTVALLLAWNRKILDYHRFVSEKRWNQRELTTGNWGCGPVTRLSSQTLGLVGFGYIGRAVARRAVALGMTVLAWSRNPDAGVATQLGVVLVGKEELLSRSDYVSLHVPFTPETRHFINEKTIRLMKPGAVLINTSRGALVDEASLASALQERHLSGALLDVYEKAPLPEEHPFRNLENLILTPHVSFYSEDALLDLRRLTAEAVLAHLSGSTLLKAHAHRGH
jgi:D-3-phosphoglycerate dehydrogenase